MVIRELRKLHNFGRRHRKLEQAIYSLQPQISSGKKYGKISDNPLKAMKGMSQRTSLVQIEQYQKNAQDGMGRLATADDAIGNVTNVLQRVRELTVQASNDTNNESDKKSIAIEIRARKEQLGTLANTTFNGSYLFSGLDQTTPPVKPIANCRTISHELRYRQRDICECQCKCWSHIRFSSRW